MSTNDESSRAFVTGKTDGDKTLEDWQTIEHKANEPGKIWWRKANQESPERTAAREAREKRATRAKRPEGRAIAPPEVDADGWFRSIRRAATIKADSLHPLQAPSPSVLPKGPRSGTDGDAGAEGCSVVAPLHSSRARGRELLDRVRLRGHRCDSWACPRCGIILSCRLRERLLGRCEGERGIMITLTINPDGFSCALEAFEFVKRNKSVARCIAEWCGAMGIAHQGQWISKLELQKNGWPHWHVLLLVPMGLCIPKKGAFDGWWKLGFSNVSHRLPVAYFAKYISKGASRHEQEERLRASGLPSFGIRWVTSARGFWDTPERPRGGDPLEIDLREKLSRGMTLESRVSFCSISSRVSFVTPGYPVFRFKPPVCPEVFRHVLVECGAEEEGEGGGRWFRCNPQIVREALSVLGVNPEGVIDDEPMGWPVFVPL